MNMMLTHLSNPVEQGYGGGDSLNVRKLQEFCSITNGNFSLIQGEINILRLELTTANHTNKQLTQLLNWIAVTNPQILDEFQTTAHAFDKLVPREPSEFAGPQSAT
jgi:hypothetical protein